MRVYARLSPVASSGVQRSVYRKGQFRDLAFLGLTRPTSSIRDWDEAIATVEGCVAAPRR